MDVCICEIRCDIRCLYLSACTQPNIPVTFENLEQICEGFTGRSIYGISGCNNGEFYYYACATEKFNNEAESLKMPVYIIAKKRYLCTTLSNWPANIVSIPKIIDRLFEHSQALKGGICIEEYYSDTDMRILIEHA